MFRNIKGEKDYNGSGDETPDKENEDSSRNDLNHPDEEDFEEPSCRHGEHYDEAERVCKCGPGQSCEGSTKPYCLDGGCKGEFRSSMAI